MVYRVGIVGCGRIGSTWEDISLMHPATIAGAFAALPDAELVAACNRGEARLRAFGQRWGVAALYHDYRAMLANEQLDIVAVATPPPSHPEVVVAAAEAGARGIFCEKPMALSLGECDAMIQACERAGAKLLVNCSRRWSGQYEAARRVVEDGTLGDLIHISAHCTGCKPTPDWEAATEGPLLHDAVHTFDILRFFAGDVEWVLGTATRRKRFESRVEDTSLVLMQFRNGVDAAVVVDELTEYERSDVELQCERGVVRQGFNAGLWQAQMEAFEQPWWYELVPAEPLALAWTERPVLLAARDLIEAIEQDRAPRCSGYDGRAAVEIIMAVYESERRGNAKVYLPLGTQESALEALRREGKL